MPNLKEKKYPQAQLIADINAGTSFVKVKPENIGDMIYFDSTEAKAAPLDEKVLARRKKNMLIYSLAALAVIWILFGLIMKDRLPLAIFLTVAVGFIDFLLFVRMHFEGTDYFVGTEGFAEYHFVKDRENVEKKEHRFDEGDVLLIQEFLLRKKDGYNNTKSDGYEYGMHFLARPDKMDVSKSLYDLVIKTQHVDKTGDSGSAEQDFIYQVEKQFTSLFLDKARQQLEAGEDVTFYPIKRENNYSDTWIREGELTLSRDSICYLGEVYAGEDLKQVSVQNGEIVFKSLNQSKGVLGRLADRRFIKLGKVGNRTALKILLGELYGIR